MLFTDILPVVSTGGRTVLTGNNADKGWLEEAVLYYHDVVVLIFCCLHYSTSDRTIFYCHSICKYRYI